MSSNRTRLWPPGQHRFRWLGWAAVTALLGTALLAPASPALSNDTPGNNGTVKIHEGAGENDPGEVRNEPHVCTFHLHFYFSDPEQAGTWEIQEWSPGDKGVVVLSGTYDTQGDGEDREPDAGVYTLPDGHYKLFWDGDLDTQKHDKMKVFWVDCPEATETPGFTQSQAAETETPAPTGTPEITAAPTGTSVVTAPPATDTPAPTMTFSQSQGAETSVPTPTFGQSVGAETNVPNVTQPNTSTAPTTGPSDPGWRGLLIALAFLVALLLVADPSRPLGTERRRR